MSLLERWISDKELKELEKEINEIFDDFTELLEKALPKSRKRESLRSLRKRAERWVDSFKKALSQRAEKGTDILIPELDLAELDNGFKIYVDLPRADKNSINLELKDHRLVITAKKVPLRLAKGEDWISQESLQGEYYRSIKLPPEVDEEKISASFKQGVLEITLPKKSAGRARTVEIRAA